MPLIVDRVVRYTLNGRWSNDQRIATVIDMHVDEDALNVSREDAINNCAEDLRDNWQDHIVGGIQNNYTFEGISWVDLDSANGDTGSKGPNTGKAITGLNTSDPALPPNICMLVRKIVGGGRGIRTGRMYLPGLAENVVDENGVVLAAGVTGWNTALQTFLSDITNVDDVQADTAYHMVVVHQPEGLPASQSKVTALLAQPLIATQRRRLKR